MNIISRIDTAPMILNHLSIKLDDPIGSEGENAAATAGFTGINVNSANAHIKYNLQLYPCGYIDPQPLSKDFSDIEVMSEILLYFSSMCCFTVDGDLVLLDNGQLATLR